MEADKILYRAIFTLFSGFILFVVIILNKVYRFTSLIDNYFVLFLFSGIIFVLIGFIMVVSWNFKNRKPFEETLQETRHEAIHFPLFLAIGTILIVAGFVSMHYLKDISRLVYYTAISSSIIGIVMLIIGLVYFTKEAVIKKNMPISRTL